MRNCLILIVSVAVKIGKQKQCLLCKLLQLRHPGPLPGLRPWAPLVPCAIAPKMKIPGSATGCHSCAVNYFSQLLQSLIFLTTWYPIILPVISDRPMPSVDILGLQTAFFVLNVPNV